ncbi:N-acetylmuramoyl-L-alanine amidase [Roseibacillus persicicus]|uniref:N-acetylmuramoyl-L-alanine amidase n=2 Tax=Roseibacillus persicicus TaxID=454148 RepID=UPI001E48F56B|nr:N-acetylmuramoyl-L-alanine amidase [Roseibacillus persicicus]
MSVFSVIRSFLLCGICLVAVLANANGAHIVKKGETLYSIATANKVSVQRLMSENGITKPTSLQIGRRLTIPGTSSKKKTASISLKTSTVTRSSSSVTKSKTVIIDPGHGGRDKGAVWGGVRESDLNLKTAFKLEYYLKRAGYKVVMTRRSDRYVSLMSRAAIANRYRNAVFVSIHYNATRETWVHGGETFHGGSSTSRYLASSLQRNLVSHCKVRNRGARYAGFTVLHNTKCPAALVECGFISNAKERARCNTSSFQDAAARSILAGIERWDRAY